MVKTRKSPTKEYVLESSPSLQSHPTHAELSAIWKSLRDKYSREDQAVWQVPEKRQSPLALMKKSNKGRLEQLATVA
mgnify:CR=1 FL=1